MFNHTDAHCSPVEKAAKDTSVEAEVPFAPGRMDASQEQTEPAADGCGNPRGLGMASAQRPTKCGPDINGLTFAVPPRGWHHSSTEVDR